MKQGWNRVLSLCLAAALTAALLALPAAAAPAALPPAGGVMDALFEVPLLGDLLRLLTDQEEEKEEADADADKKATGESATPETATPETATPETGAKSEPPAAPAPDEWAEPWMVGAVLPGASYPAGDPEAEPALQTDTPLWAAVTLGESMTTRVADREETNFGSLLADAVSYAVAATEVWQQTETLHSLPLVSLVDGASLLDTVPAGTTLTAENIGDYLADETISLVVVDAAKLRDILNLMLTSLDPDRAQQADAGQQDAPQAGFLQVSGLRLTYKNTNSDYQLGSVWLPGRKEQGAQPLADDQQLALALPADLLELYGVNAEASAGEDAGTDNAPAAGYTDYLAAAALSSAQPAAPVTLQSALLDLTKNCDEATLAALLARQGSCGRIQPAQAAPYNAVVPTSGQGANGTATVFVDGAETTAAVDAEGRLTIQGLAAGSHTIRLTPDGEARYVSNVTYLGTENGVALPALTQPEGWQVTPAATPTPSPAATPTPSPAATPTPKPTATPQPASSQTQTVTVQGEAATPAPTPTPTPAPAATPAATPALTPRPAAQRTPAPVRDPLAGTIIGTTPAPTLQPTPTPTPTPAPTPSPEEVEKAEQTAQESSRLPLYIGIGVLALGAGTVAVVAVRRKLEGGPRNRYRRNR